MIVHVDVAGCGVGAGRPPQCADVDIRCAEIAIADANRDVGRHREADAAAGLPGKTVALEIEVRRSSSDYIKISF